MDLDETYSGIGNAYDLADEVWGEVRDLQDGILSVEGAGVAYSRLGAALEYLTRARTEIREAHTEISDLIAEQEEAE